MGIYQRTTREMRLEWLPEVIQTAIQRHLEQNNLGPILADDIMCVETVSDKKKKGLFKGPRPKQVTSYAILTPTWLIYAAVDESGIASAMSVPLAEVIVEDYKNSPFYAKMPDNGFFITGNFTGQVGMQGRQHVSIFLGLGEERDARIFGEALLEAIAKTRR